MKRKEEMKEEGLHTLHPLPRTPSFTLPTPIALKTLNNAPVHSRSIAGHARPRRRVLLSPVLHDTQVPSCSPLPLLPACDTVPASRCLSYLLPQRSSFLGDAPLGDTPGPACPF